MLTGMRTILPLLALFMLAIFDSPARAWSYKEHIQFTRLAATRLIADPDTPPEMKAWLERAIPNRPDLAGEREFFLRGRVGINPKGFETGLLHWTYEPDVRANRDPKDSKIEPFAAHERLMHFIDLEYFLTGPTTRAYRHDLSAKLKIENIPNDASDPRFIQAGFLPLRVEQVHRELVDAIRAKDEKQIDRWAGYLAHYVADNTQPHHATIDYKSNSYFKNPRRAPNGHSAMEYLMCDDEKNDYPELRAEFWAMFERQLHEFDDPIETDDLFAATLEVAMRSYDSLPLIGQAAVAATGPDGKLDVEKFFRYPGMMEMKARQTAWAVKRIGRVWKQAWQAAREPASPKSDTSNGSRSR
jgi:hypothetical protein